jgi:glycerol-3-phosphate dehydrogenase
MSKREVVLRTIHENPAVSVLIIGAGINGIGTFRDLAMQGVDVLMVDRSDFCSGASAASSHMVHGGIRYLENGEFRLVREAVQERNLLIQNAPHYVKPLPTTFPIFKWFSGIFNAPFKFLGLLDKPAERGALVIKIGMMLYDAYTGSKQTVPRHTFRSRPKSLEMFPQLNPEIIFTATYYDAAMTIPERICMDLIHDSENVSNQVWAINYMPVVDAHNQSVLLRDDLSGEIYAVSPGIVVNAAGPWIDFVNQAMGKETRFIGGTKGSHLVLHHPELRAAIGDHEFFFENQDGRIVLIFPLEDKVLVGTSDIRIEDPDQAQCTEEEINYFLDMIKRVFPTIHVDRSHIVYRFSGVRPLPASESSPTSQISRDHSIELVKASPELEFSIFCLVGGKWTSFRAFAQQTTDVVLAHLGLPRKLSTAHLAIGGGKDYPHSESERNQWLCEANCQTGLESDRLQILFERYGTRARQIAGFIASGPDKPLHQLPDFSQREILYLVQQEMVLHLEDLVRRRTNLAKLGRLTPESIHELAHIVGEVLSWSPARKEEELERCLHLMKG